MPWKTSTIKACIYFFLYLTEEFMVVTCPSGSPTNTCMMCECVLRGNSQKRAGGTQTHSHTQACMQIKAINSLWWSETSWHKQSVSLPWKPLSPHRPRDRKKHKEPTRQGGSDKKQWQAALSSPSGAFKSAYDRFHLFPFSRERHDCTVRVPKEKGRSSLKCCLIAGWTFTTLMSTWQSFSSRQTAAAGRGFWNHISPLPAFSFQRHVFSYLVCLLPDVFVWFILLSQLPFRQLNSQCLV